MANVRLWNVFTNCNEWIHTLQHATCIRHSVSQRMQCTESSRVQFRGIGLLVLKYLDFFALNTHSALVVALSEAIQYGYIGNVELMQECFPKHSRMGTPRMKYDKDTEEKGKKRGASMERSKAGRKEVKRAGKKWSGQERSEAGRKEVKRAGEKTEVQTA